MPAITPENLEDLREEPSRISRYPVLKSSIQLDVAIVGSGLTAVQTALELYKAGARVALVAPGELAGEAGDPRDDLLNAVEPSNYASWHEVLGLEKGSRVAAAYRSSIQELQIKAEAWPECHFVSTPTFTVAEHVEDLLGIERECAMGRALNGDCWFVRDVQLPFHCAGASRDNQQCKLQASQFLRAMTSELQMLGGEVYEHSPLVLPPAIGSTCRITTEHGKISAKSVLFSGRLPHANLLSISSRLVTVHSYMMAVRADRPIGDAIYVVGGQPKRMLWRSHRTDDCRFILRADYDGAQRESQLLRLEELSCYGASRFSLKRVDHRWSQHRLAAVDDLPIAGRIPGLENAYVAIGMGPTELPWGMACGTLLSQMIRDKSSPPLAEIFDPQRLAHASTTEEPRRYTAARSGAAQRFANQNAAFAKGAGRGSTPPAINPTRAPYRPERRQFH